MEYGSYKDELLRDTDGLLGEEEIRSVSKLKRGWYIRGVGAARGSAGIRTQGWFGGRRYDDESANWTRAQQRTPSS